jgi:hypothetical protein
MGDPGGEIQLRRDGLAGLAHLVAVRVPAGVDGRPGRPHRGAEQVGELFYKGEVAGLLDPQRLLGGVLVELGEPARDIHPVDRAVGLEAPVTGEVGGELDEHDDLRHGLPSRRSGQC